MRARGGAAGAVAAATLAAAGCMLFYDLGTGGYVVGSEAGAGFLDCGSDASCPNLTLTCLGAQDCDGGSACCLVVGQGLNSAQSACSTPPCGGAFPVQLCKSNSECSQGSCVAQVCTFGMNSVALSACGLQVICNAR